MRKERKKTIKRKKKRYVIEKKKKAPKTPIKKRKKKALSKPDIFKRFVAWMSLFEPLRKPKTQGEFAKEFRVSPDTLSDWKKRDDFWEAVEEEWGRWGKEKTSNVMQKFYQKLMKEGMTPDFKLWFQFFLKWSEKAEIEHSGEVNVSISYTDGKRKRKGK